MTYRLDEKYNNTKLDENDVMIKLASYLKVEFKDIIHVELEDYNKQITITPQVIPEIIKSLAFNNGVETLLITKGDTKKIRKVLHLPKLEGDGSIKEWKLFERTIEKIETLKISHIPKFLSKGKTDSSIWYEYANIEGENLKDLISRKTLNKSQIENIVEQLFFHTKRFNKQWYHSP